MRLFQLLRSLLNGNLTLTPVTVGKETILLKHNLDPLSSIDIRTISFLFYRLEQTQRND